MYWGPLRDSSSEEIILGLYSSVWDCATPNRNTCKEQPRYLWKAPNKEDRQSLGNVSKEGKHWAK